MRSNQGFTIIELVVVIVIIGILAATALPRFVDITDEAYDSNVQAMGTSIRSSVNMIHAGWIAAGATDQQTSVTIEGGATIGVTSSGWPENTAGTQGDETPTADECLALWNAVLNGPPSNATTAGSDWQTSAAGSDCIYTYMVDRTTVTRTVTYDTADGTVVVAGV
jgi:prepilin-type N-terminal cleavage/methylation domain-containing protein